jgi:hypothetical protein
MPTLNNPRNAVAASIIGTNPYACPVPAALLIQVDWFQEGFVVRAKWLRRRQNSMRPVPKLAAGSASALKPGLSD